MGPWDVSPSTLEIMGTNVVPSNFCNWLLFFFWALLEDYSASPDLLAESNERRKE